MKCLCFILILLALTNVLADTNVYKKDFEETGKAYYFEPSKEYEGQKIAVGENCVKVVVTCVDQAGTLIGPSVELPLSACTGQYLAEMVRYPGGKCTLPDTQKYNKEVISSKPEELVNYYNNQPGGRPKYTFEVKNKDTSIGGGIFKNKWMLIGIGGGALILIIIIVIIIVISKKKDKKDDYSRYSSNDKDMKAISEPYIGLSNNDSKDNFSIGQPFNTSTTLPTPLGEYNSWNRTGLSSNSGSSSNLLSAPAEPKRVNSITFEEQENYSNLMKKHMENSPKIQKSPSFGKPTIPDEYEKFKTFKVVRKFTPQRNDELVVENGHLVKMIKSFEDGWTLCYNINTKKEGYIPKNKLAAFEQPQKPQSIFHSDTTSTSSSAYSTKPLLHSNSGASSNSYYSSNNSYGRNRGRGVNSRNNSNASSRTGTGGRMGGSPQNSANKYYRRPSNDNYINNGYARGQNSRYDM
ncbi:hypothetical protein BCR32DRAFT_241221 [Anaeromyces robustus]|jgi:hypothetical protein|uniref:SH3 domain-containing protein n=1 Tax=Anaeromyces robustus TaxID=1754192 RepID=A0A1Y1XKE2_9FUNG|nr:hypothetical protein BCR32DRAFT_292734 [Anaeromyces robustus]ORX86227.1 hypothetical protein BCR32DRAFT_241221 [Anaeromyces robustus]|eukprot:ORX82348.1 hypothetical protein BCR32DRAFT_292734 [Anaeromyces robustus]